MRSRNTTTSRLAPRTRARTAAVALTALAVVLTGCSADGSSSVAAPAGGVPAPAAPLVPTYAPGPVTEAPVAEPTEAPVPTASPTLRRPLPPPYDVKLVQRQLTEQGYYIGAIDGARGAAMRSAVMAFQKVNGLGADGVVGKATLAALKAPRTPSLRGTGAASRVEIDLTKQVLYVVKGGKISRILPVSSGNGATYLQKDGGKARALTPTGYFKIQRRIIGERKADLGSLYDPQYFYRGWAIHGSNSVPAFPASHGCVRVTRRDATWLLGQIGVGTGIYLYGGTHTFTAGSAAPGTDAPSGDTEPVAPEPTDEPTAEPTTSPKPSASSQPTSQPTQPAPVSTSTPRPTTSSSPSPRPTSR